MLIDKENLLSLQQAITASANSTNTIDLGPNMWSGHSGSDEEIPIFATITESFAAAGAATLEIIIESSNDVAFGSGVVQHNRSKAYAIAELAVLGRLGHSMSIPPDVKRYLRARYVVTTGPFTAGKITLGVTASRQTNR